MHALRIQTQGDEFPMNFFEKMPKTRIIHRSAWRDCMKKGRGVVFRYSSMHEKTLPNGSFRCRMELHRASLACYQGPWATADPQPPRDPRCHLLRPKKRLPVAHASSRLPSMAHRLPLLQKMAH